MNSSNQESFNASELETEKALKDSEYNWAKLKYTYQTKKDKRASESKISFSSIPRLAETWEHICS